MLLAKPKNSAAISPYLEDQDEETDRLLEKRIKSVKKSQILKDCIRNNQCGFVSETLLREDPVQAFQSAIDSTKPHSLPSVVRVQDEEDPREPLKRSNSNIEFFSQDYLANVPRRAHLHQQKDPQHILLERIVGNSTIKNKKLIGMLLGSVIVGSAFSIALGGILIILISAIIGFGLGGACGSCIRKRYKDVSHQMTAIERAKFRAKTMIAKFDEIKKGYDKETATVLLEKIAYEGKKIMALSGDRMHPIIQKIKEFILTGEVSSLLEENIDNFDSMCSEPKDEQIPRIMEVVFNLYIPLLKILAPEKGKHLSLYKRIAMSLYGKNTLRIVKTTTAPGGDRKCRKIFEHAKEASILGDEEKDNEVIVLEEKSPVAESKAESPKPDIARTKEEVTQNNNPTDSLAAPPETKIGQIARVPTNLHKVKPLCELAGDDGDISIDLGDDSPNSKQNAPKEVRINLNPLPRPAEESKKSPKLKRKPHHKPSSSPVKKPPPKRIVNPEIIRLMNIINESTDGEEWVRVVNEKNITFYKKSVADCPVVLVKGMALLEGVPLEVMWKAIADSKVRMKWETLFSTFEIVENNPKDGSEVIYFALKAPFPVQDRDFLQKRTILFDYPAKGHVLMHFESIDHPKKPPTSRCVRAHTHIAGYYFKELSQFPLRCALYIVTQVDIKGLIPKSIVNMFAARSSRNWVEAYKKGCMQIMEQMKAKK